jgi:hypothetical protein
VARIYTGIGSSKAPKYILIKMKRISYLLNKKGYVLRSGGAKGSDSYFELSSTRKEIFLPFKDFNGNNSEFYDIEPIYFDIARIYFKNFDNESFEEQCFIARDVQQVINNGVKSNFVICWTRNGAIDSSFSRKRSGGTWYAIALASFLNIPVFNLNFYSYNKL